jgi:cyclopropane-fatty-acyl-phospholipid synthase
MKERSSWFTRPGAGEERRPAAVPERPAARLVGAALARTRSRTPLAAQIWTLMGEPPDVNVRAFDGSTAGPPDTPATAIFVRPEAFTRLIGAPGEMGFARAVVAGDLILEGDLRAAMEPRHALNDRRWNLALLADVAKLVHASGASLRPLPPPAEEIRVKGRRHSQRRDATAVSHHYDVGNDFYRLLLGPTMAYSCAVWEKPDVGLEAAQDAKHELICAKLGVPALHQPRLLDVGCGWGGMLVHAARHHGAHGVGITLSEEQAAMARTRIAGAGLDDRLEVRVQDYRDVADGPYDAISSIGMVEHVGEAQLPGYFAALHALLRPGGRLLNHGITIRHGTPARIDPRGFMQHYIFPDAEVPNVAAVLDALQGPGFEVRHVENLREHYVLTLRAWLGNLEARWDEAVDLVGANRARVWRLYLAGVMIGFEENRTQLHQVLAVKLDDRFASGLPLRPDW